MATPPLTQTLANNSDDIARALVKPYLPQGKTAPAAKAKVPEKLVAGRAAQNGTRVAGNVLADDTAPQMSTEEVISANLGKADEIMGHANIGIFAAQGILPMAAGGVAWVGSQVGSKTMGSVAKGMEGVAGATFQDIGRYTGTEGIFGAISRGATKVAALGADALHAVGITPMIANFYGGQVERRGKQMAQAAESIFSHNVSHKGLNTALTDLRTHLSTGFLHADGRMMNQPLELGALKSHLMNGAAHKINFEEAGKALNAAKTLAVEAGDKALKGKLGKLEKAMTHAESAAFFHDAYGNLSQHVRNGTETMAKTGAMHGLMQASFIASAGISDVRLGLDLNVALRNLRDMHCAISGQKPEDVSTMGLLFGQNSEPVMQAASEIFKEYGASAVLNAANTVLQVKTAVNSKYGGMLKSFLLMFALPLVDGVVARGLLGGSVLPAYKEMKDAQKRGEEVPLETYEKLLGSASRELAARGGEGSNFTKALAIFYHDHKASADTMLKEVSNGTLTKRITQLTREYEEYARSQFNVHSRADGHKVQPEEVTHVARLNGEASHAHREVLGEQTAKLQKRSLISAERAADPNLSQTI